MKAVLPLAESLTTVSLCIDDTTHTKYITNFDNDKETKNGQLAIKSMG